MMTKIVISEGRGERMIDQDPNEDCDRNHDVRMAMIISDHQLVIARIIVIMTYDDYYRDHDEFQHTCAGATVGSLATLQLLSLFLAASGAIRGGFQLGPDGDQLSSQPRSHLTRRSCLGHLTLGPELRGFQLARVLRSAVKASRVEGGRREKGEGRREEAGRGGDTRRQAVESGAEMEGGEG